MTASRVSHQGRLPGWETARELAGPILTAATAFSLIRLFDGNAWVLPVSIAAAASHLLALAVRRLGLGMLISTLTSGAGLILTVTWTRYWDTAALGMPAGDTRAALTDDMETAWTAFGDISPPVAPLNGFTVSAMAGIWLIAFLGDWTAMRIRALFGPMLLPVVAIGFVGLVGDHEHRVLTTAVFTATLLLFAVVQRVAARTAETAWLGDEGRASTGRRSLLAAGAALAVIAFGGAMAAGPVLGSNEDPLVDLAGAVERRLKSSERVVISPLVDIRGRLVSQAETPMFRVRAEERSYWRLTSLDQFDGRVWTSRADYDTRSTRLPSLFQSGSSVLESVQEFTIEQLSAIWLPTAFEPRSVSSATADISYEPSSSTLIVGRSLVDSNGLAYTVTSALPRFDPEALKAIPLDAPTGIPVDRYTELPSDFSPRVRLLADRLTAESRSGYEQALALQDFFRGGGFTYDTDIAPGHSGNRIEEFLNTRRGYCEQFAGTFAAMARSLGLPARVAVGFTPGEADPDNPGVYLVRGRHAHAWPEVYLAGVGWAAFEPTPDRGAPGAQSYTGLAENQAGGGFAPAAPAENPAINPPGDIDASTDSESLPPPESDDLGDAQTVGTSDRGGVSWRAWTAVAALILVVVLILFTPWFKQIQNRRRFSAATGNRGKIRLLWTEAVESLAQINMIPRPEETYAEFARRAIKQVPLHSPDLQHLGELAAAAAFAPSAPADHNQRLARAWSLSVQAEVGSRMSRRQKLAAAFNPRPLLGVRRREQRRPSRSPGTRSRSHQSRSVCSAAPPRRRRLRMRRPGDRK